MQKVIIALATIAAIVTAAGLYKISHQSLNQDLPVPTSVYQTWMSWKMRNGKAYGTDSEEKFRLQRFYQNVIKIQNHMNNKEATWEMELNQFADLSVKEFAATYRNMKPDAQEDTKEALILSTESVAESKDWRAEGAVTDVKDQGQCGSCWAFSTTGGLEGLNFLTNKKLEAFSEQQLVDCNGFNLWPFNIGNMGCNGGLMSRAWPYVERKGIETESNYPYLAKTGSCHYDEKKALFKNKSWEKVRAGDNDQLVAAISQRPVPVAINADPLQLYKGGIINDWSCSSMIDHGVLAVGYGSENGKLFYLVKNSWGAKWGEAGYFRFERKTGKGTGMCGITNQPSYPTA